MLREDAREFERLCALLMQTLQFHVTREEQIQPRRLVDIVARRRNEIAYVVEVKLIYEIHSGLAKLRNTISNANAQLSSLGSFRSDQKLIILNCYIAAEHRQWLSQEYNVTIWGRDEINIRISETGFNEFWNFFSELDLKIKERELSRPPVSRMGGLRDEFAEIRMSVPRLRGELLCSTLRSVDSGKKGAKEYEKLILEILQYLFGDYLLDGNSQARTTDNINIFDVIFRVKQGNPFWDTLTRDFRARVIMFECKNYGKPIQPMQLFTSERYLSANAFRPVCFMMSRFKPHDHTELAAFGSMREGGKLFVFIDDNDICEMLKLRDTQLRLDSDEKDYFENDPTVLLDQKIFRFLSKMPR